MIHKLSTVWGERLDPDNLLTEYPRPQLERDNYTILNGYWQYTVSPTPGTPSMFPGRILVPFCPESALSGADHVLLPGEYLWYRRTFEIEQKHDGQRLLLNFGAVDQLALIYVNGHKAGSHVGGYLPFSVDITKYIHAGTNELTVCARDLTDKGYYARGKQKLEPGGMFYTPVSGIWQTVWTEWVPEHYISGMHITPDFDNSRVNIELAMDGSGIYGQPDRETVVIVREGEELIGRYTVQPGERIRLWLPGFREWTPEDPFLYTFELTMGEDRIKSYFAMRKFSTGTDSEGVSRLMLNNRPYFHNGLLDQGYWPDGLYTAPSDEALIYDIEECKKMGFNMLRKHAKIESARWYYHCDRLGMLVWQDIVNGGAPLNSAYVTYMPTVAPFTQAHTPDRDNPRMGRTSDKSKAQYTSELKETIDCLYNCPSIAMWTLFNEGWGQFDSLDALKTARSLDPTRTIDHASGWFDQGGSDVKSLHIYFTPFKLKPDKRPIVISEFGGYALPIERHVYCDKVYGYRKYTDKASFTEAYEALYRDKIIPLIPEGLSAAIYTQVSDIEEEINGLLTYDRKELKIDCDAVHRINKQLSYDSAVAKASTNSESE